MLYVLGCGPTRNQQARAPLMAEYREDVEADVGDQLGEAVDDLGGSELDRDAAER
jgi:hypothetical protein